MMQSRRIMSSPLEIFEFDGAAGDSYKIEAAEDMEMDDNAQFTIMVKGCTETKRLTGTASGTGHSTLKAGEMNFESHRDKVNAGEFEVKVVEDCRYYCIRHVDNIPLHKEGVRVKAGEKQTLLKGVLLFIADGSLEIKGSTFSAPAILEVESPSVEFIAKSDVLGVAMKDWE